MRITGEDDIVGNKKGTNVYYGEVEACTRSRICELNFEQLSPQYTNYVLFLFLPLSTTTATTITTANSTTPTSTTISATIPKGDQGGLQGNKRKER